MTLTVDVRAADAPTVLITGSSRGIGLELARNYAERGWTVIATCRNPAKALDLQAIRKSYPNVTIEALDVTDGQAIHALAAAYKSTPIDVLINNAGISGDDQSQVFGEFRYEVYNQVHAVNVLGPLRMAEAFIDHVAASNQKKIINITSTMGSIASTRGRNYFYRSSKTALNMVMRTLSVELRKKDVTVGLISPGFVKTDFTKGMDFPMMITARESATAVIGIIDDYSLDKTGTFMRHNGEEAPW